MNGPWKWQLLIFLQAATESPAAHSVWQQSTKERGEHA